ncbi:hypothetical protein CAAN1_31S00166 [[Candida] anglica]|uniref:Uncharacterized protein n=1 Tax=[Candida] anglica TaxID=148631 RepID=A0ABP0EH86_9ASCO
MIWGLLYYLTMYTVYGLVIESNLAAKSTLVDIRDQKISIESTLKELMFVQKGNEIEEVNHSTKLLILSRSLLEPQAFSQLGLPIDENPMTLNVDYNGDSLNASIPVNTKVMVIFNMTTVNSGVPSSENPPFTLPQSIYFSDYFLMVPFLSNATQIDASYFKHPVLSKGILEVHKKNIPLIHKSFNSDNPILVFVFTSRKSEKSVPIISSGKFLGRQNSKFFDSFVHHWLQATGSLDEVKHSQFCNINGEFSKTDHCIQIDEETNSLKFSYPYRDTSPYRLERRDLNDELQNLAENIFDKANDFKDLLKETSENVRSKASSRPRIRTSLLNGGILRGKETEEEEPEEEGIGLERYDPYDTSSIESYRGISNLKKRQGGTSAPTYNLHPTLPRSKKYAQVIFPQALQSSNVIYTEPSWLQVFGYQ